MGNSGVWAVVSGLVTLAALWIPAFAGMTWDEGALYGSVGVSPAEPRWGAAHPHPSPLP